MADQPNDQDQSFEQQLRELEALVARLESGELDLDRSMLEFKRGVELTRNCRQLLDAARQSVQELQDPDDESSLRTSE